jgi:hypothetical protein
MMWALIRVVLFAGSFLIGLFFFGPERPTNVGHHATTPASRRFDAPSLPNARNLRLILL